MKHFAEGRRIVEVREMTAEEQRAALGFVAGGINGPPTVIVLDDGSHLYAMQDSEGNGFGSLAGWLKDGTQVYADAWTKREG